MTATAHRVLVVDDEASNFAFVERVLTNEGYTVVCAADGREALRLVEQQQFDLILLDVLMPQMQGDELARQIRLANPDAKILYLTGYADRLSPTVLNKRAAFVSIRTKDTAVAGFGAQVARHDRHT